LPSKRSLNDQAQGKVMMNRSSLELRSKISTDGMLELFLEEAVVPATASDELVVRAEQREGSI
jgi:hypothetical protein